MYLVFQPTSRCLKSDETLNLSLFKIIITYMYGMPHCSTLTSSIVFVFIFILISTDKKKIALHCPLYPVVQMGTNDILL